MKTEFKKGETVSFSYHGRSLIGFVSQSDSWLTTVLVEATDKSRSAFARYLVPTELLGDVESASQVSNPDHHHVGWASLSWSFWVPSNVQVESAP